MKEARTLSFIPTLFEGELLCHAHKDLQQPKAAAPIETSFTQQKEENHSDNCGPLGKRFIATGAQSRAKYKKKAISYSRHKKPFTF